MVELTQSFRSEGAPSDVDVRAELARVFQSNQFAQSERFRDFLEYVVNEALSGRGDAIRGKTIAQDVYGREPTEGGDPENIVRVHARQVRQALSVYYETDGVTSTTRIHLDAGGYCPRFETVELSKDGSHRRRSMIMILPVLAFVLGGLAGAIFFYSNPEETSPATSELFDDPKQQIARQAVMDKSAISLQAVNLAEQARGMIFPIFDRSRQDLVHTVFEHVVELDPTYSGGHAGAAQVLATKALISPPGEGKGDLIDRANDAARRAVELDPADAWTQSALAWVEVAKGDYALAFELSSRAKELAPDNGHVMDFHGAVSLFSGRFEDAIVAADRTKARGGSNQRFANRNIYGAANFHLGNFELTLAGFDEAAAFGDPVSAPSLAYQAAALQRLGRDTEGRRKLAELERSWPGAPLDVMFEGIYRDTGHAEDILNPLRELGWEPKTDTEPN